MPPTTFSRRPTPEELDLILKPVSGLRGWASSLVAAAALLIVVFLVVLLLVSFLDGPPPWTVPTALACGVAAGAGLFVFWQKRETRAAAHRAADRAKAAEGEVTVTRYEALDAIGVEEVEDEGLHYYLLLDDGRTLFLSGQYLYAPAERGFPWRVFEIVRIPSEDWVLAVVSRGDPLPPSHTRRPFTEDEMRRDSAPVDGTVASLDWASLKTAAA